jgi:hypothetical protein
MKFQRIGSLKLTKQKGYDSSVPWFHSPPMSKGVYAFPWPYFEWFLLGNSDYSGVKSKYAKFEYEYNSKGERIKWDDIYESIDKDNKTELENILNKFKDSDGYILKPKRIRIFNYDGLIWHHLNRNVKPGQIIKQKGDWYLSEMSDYKELLKLEEHNMKKDSIGFLKKHNNELNLNVKNIYTIDHLEVFISNKI